MTRENTKEYDKIKYMKYDEDNNLSYFKTYYKGTLHGMNTTTKAKAVHRILQKNITSPLTYSFIEIDMNDEKFYKDISNHKIYFSCKVDSFTTFVEIGEYMFQLYKGSCGENDLEEAYGSNNNNINKVMNLIISKEQIKKAIDFYIDLENKKIEDEAKKTYNIIKSYIRRIENYSINDVFVATKFVDSNKYKEYKQSFIDYLGDNPIMFCSNSINGKSGWLINKTLYELTIKELDIEDFICMYGLKELERNEVIDVLYEKIEEIDNIFSFTLNDKMKTIVDGYYRT